MSRVKQIASRVDNVASLPMVVQEVISACNHPATDAKSLAPLIAKDPVLAAKLIKTANSSLFAFVSSVNDIDQAVARLGVKQVRSLALALSVGKLFSCPEDSDGYSRLNIWSHSVAVGTMCEVIVKCAGLRALKPLAGEALLAGLVHDFGIIIADEHMPKKYQEIPALAAHMKEPFFMIEHQRLGFTHAELGAEVLKGWKLPDEILRAVSQHHSYKSIEEMEPLCLLVMISDLLVSDTEYGFSDMPGLPKQTFSKAAKQLGFTGAALPKSRELFEARIEDALKIFSVDSKAKKKAPTFDKAYAIDESPEEE